MAAIIQLTTHNMCVQFFTLTTENAVKLLIWRLEVTQAAYN